MPPMTTLDRRQLLTGLGAGALLAAVNAGCRTARAPASPAPAPQAPRTSRIVVVGAGLSGLAIAHELVKRGRDVLVLEATAIPGGRIRTIRGFRDGLYVEAGAKHVMGDPDLMALIEESGVARTGFPREPLARVRLRRGERLVLAPGAPEPEQHDLSAEERALGEEGCTRRYLGIVDRVDPRAMQWSGELAALDRLTAADWLRGMGASPGYIADKSRGLPLGDGLESISALSYVRELAVIQAETAAAMAAAAREGRSRGPGGRIAGGTDNLPRALAGQLGARVVYGAEVQRIERRDDGVVLVVRDRTGQHRIDAARVVLTMPFPVLRRIEVAPGWSAAKAAAIAALGMTSVTRLWLESDRRFWRDRGEAGRVETDTELRVVQDETDGFPGEGGVLGLYLTGPTARAWGALDKAASIQRGVDEIERLQPGLRDHFVGGERVVWDREPFVRGAYACFTPGQLTQHAAAAAAPEGVIHFAGDGTSYRPGFMHGAVASAKRVLAEIAATTGEAGAGARVKIAPPIPG
jgi:monoamine oxidase